MLKFLVLKTGVTPSASGSSYLELQRTDGASQSTSSSKLACTVHGPRPLPKNAAFSPHVVLTTHVKFAPFATAKRRGYVRDNSERDLGVHLETALRGVIIGDRWPKSAIEIVVTILEGEEDHWWGDEAIGSRSSSTEWGLMSVLSGCITVASAAIVDAGIDCVDITTGGIAALVQKSDSKDDEYATEFVIDPVPSEHQNILAACTVAYLPNRDEITNVWIRGRLGASERSVQDHDRSSIILTDYAVQAACGSQKVLLAALKEASTRKKRT